MKPELQRRIQRYGWDKAAGYYENSWQEQLRPAHDLLMKMANVRPNENVIEIAAGTGLVTFKVAEKIGPGGKIIATDISDEMVKIGNNKADSKKITQVSFERMDAENITYSNNSFDLAICALGMMYFPEPESSLAEIYRVLKPGGRMVAAVWGSRKKCGWSEIFPIVDARVKTDVCPLFFNLGEGEVLKYFFENAGFKEISSVKIATSLNYRNAEEACEASFLGGPVAMAYSRFDDNTKTEAKIEYIKSIEAYKTEHGYQIPGEFVVCSGVKA